MKDVLLIKYGEIALRGDNRALFEKALIYNIRAALTRYGNFWVTKEQGRFLLETESDMDYSYFIPRLLDVFGVVGVCAAVKCDGKSMESVLAAAERSVLAGYGEGVSGTFKVETRRADKSFPMGGNDLSAAVGEFLLGRFPGLRVDVREPEMTVRVEIRTRAYVYAREFPGQRGLPYGSGGKAAALLSGGIDSPVAAYLTARRGVTIECVYFHSPPFVSERAKEKVRDIGGALSRFMPGLRLYAVPFTETQLYLKERVARERLTTFLKRAMLSCAAVIARRSGALALVTGDSIGQVASQTLESINAIDSAAGMPVIRPLAAMDKNETTAIAERIGTYEISIRPYEDCCTVFVAEHPETKPKRGVIEAIEGGLAELPGLIENAAAGAEILEL
ncbi:MAG: tRNA 4-thiouridine(8) synthase ThiI [Clostridiales bacterium]|jgi:thiamine biosynthesis protein ThiI|nr:tRNA 4-thiouridine(8) synthase ThiI [Clostridiales bacterium]